jgi:hypothetical protein
VAYAGNAAFNLVGVIEHHGGLGNTTIADALQALDIDQISTVLGVPLLAALLTAAFMLIVIGSSWARRDRKQEAKEILTRRFGSDVARDLFVAIELSASQVRAPTVEQSFRGKDSQLEP